MLSRPWPSPWLLALALVGCDGSPREAKTFLPLLGAVPATAPPATAAPEPAPSCDPPERSAPYEGPVAGDLEPTPGHVSETLAELADRHPCVTERERIATTHEGRAVWALHVGKRRNAPSMLLAGGHHGDEPLSMSFVLDAARYLLGRRGDDARVNRLLEELSITVVPLVNPDGLVVHRAEARRLGRDPGTEDGRSPGRKNGRDNDGDGRLGPNDGVDLNRNYPFKWGFLGEQGSTSAYALRIYRGPEPASEPETQGMIALANREVFAAAVSFHIGAVTVLAPYTIPQVADPDPNEAFPIARDMADFEHRHPSVAATELPVRRRLYAVDGTEQDWHRHTHGTLAYLVEGALRGTGEEQRSDVVRAVRQIWLRLADRLLDGPAIIGRVLDASGRPVAAEVHLADRELHEDESWRARCRDGRFVRFVEEAGRHDLRVRIGDLTVEREVRVEGATEVTIRLPSGVEDRCPS